MLYLASRPRPSAIFHIVHERMRYFNWFIVFLKFCAVLELMCRVLRVSSAFWKWNSGRISLNKSFPLAFCVLGCGILSTTLGMGDWTSDGDNDDSLMLFTSLVVNRNCKTVTGLDSASGAFFFCDLRLRRWRFAEGPVTKSLLPLSLRSVGSPCRTTGHRCRHR